MAIVTVTWKAFGGSAGAPVTTATIEIPNDFALPQFHNSVLESIFEDTNLYRGFFWNLIEPKLSPVRTHTALSVGDEIEIDGTKYLCANVGFKKVGA